MRTLRWRSPRTTRLTGRSLTGKPDRRRRPAGDSGSGAAVMRVRAQARSRAGVWAGECRPRPRSCAVLLQKLLIAAFDASTARRRLDLGSADRRGKLWRRSNVVSGSRRQTCLQFLCARCCLLVLTLGSFGACSRSLHGTALTLTQRFVPGLAIDLPDWATSGAADDYENGILQLRSPGGNDSMTLSWVTDGDRAGGVLDSIETSLKRTGYTQEGSSRQVAGHTAWRWKSEADGSNTVVTFWTCPVDNRTITLTVSSPLVISASMLSDQMLSSARCHLGGAHESKTFQRTRYSPPPGWRSVNPRPRPS